MNDQELLMKQITEETYLEDESNSSPVNLVQYFEKRLNEVDYLCLDTYLDNEELLNYKLNYNDATKCYRVSIAQSEIDFPMNWSIFRKFYSDDIAFVNSADDCDFLCEVFLSLVGEVRILVLVKNEQDLYLIFLNNENAEKQLDWIKNYHTDKINKNRAKLLEKKAS